ncbi:MAG: hypothetical protein JO117_06780 [Verrucomicrobia bacterium]|nr:hypothetical protein [Verrucomicrobiota bacterium]
MPGKPRTHDWIDERSLALHRAIVAHLRADPQRVVARAKANLARWMRTAGPRARPVLREWSEILESQTPDALARLLTSRDERTKRLRQSSPFAGVLSSAERDAVFREYESLLA